MHGEGAGGVDQVLAAFEGFNELINSIVQVKSHKLELVG